MSCFWRIRRRKYDVAATIPCLLLVVILQRGNCFSKFSDYPYSPIHMGWKTTTMLDWSWISSSIRWKKKKLDDKRSRRTTTLLATSRLLRRSGADGMKITSYQMLGSVPIEGSGGGWYYPFTSLLLGNWVSANFSSMSREHLPESSTLSEGKRWKMIYVDL